MYSQVMKSIITVLASLAVLGCAQDDREEILKSYMEAHNAHDIEQALSFVDDDIVFDLKGVWVKEGKAAMKTLEKWDSTLNSNLSLESVSLKADTLFCKVVENNDWFKAVGITDLVHDPVAFIIKDDQIKNIVAYPSQETGKKIESAVGSIYQWSAQVKDSTIHELIIDGQFIYSSEAANKWLELFERRSKSTDSLK